MGSAVNDTRPPTEEQVSPPDPPPRESIIVPGTGAGSIQEAWKLAYPTIIGMLSTTVMWTIDSIFLGRVGKVELAAAGFGGMLIWTLYTFFVGGVHAVTTFVSQAKGAGNHRECSVFAWQGVYLALGGAVILTFFLWKMDWVLALAKPDEAVIQECLRCTVDLWPGALSPSDDAGGWHGDRDGQRLGVHSDSHSLSPAQDPSNLS
jgi:hypothetical protein